MTVRARIGDVDIAWEDEGDPEAPVLLLLHGFTGHRDDFLEVRADLARTHRVIVPDLRGHGDSGPSPDPAGYTFDALVDDLERLLVHLGVEQIDLLGHSFGGMLALRFALAHPERLRSLTLMSTSPESPVGMSADGFEHAIQIVLEQGMAELQRRAEAAGRSRVDPVIERWADLYWPHHARRYLAMDPAAYAGLGRAMVGQCSLTPRLGEIEVPTLILVGAHDSQFLPGADLLDQHLPAARRITFPEAGHHPHQESRVAFLAAVAEHLRRTGAQPDAE
ncbi:MAG: alpha/beta fold hydrolase [Deltaproteobacteria bacterium]|nr:alpha/beta fold hydrolase [Deltaproteobacteria bacterium]MBW2383136.1 alpha/beta fold hydrolase [Deltaproteobacteria bacterium]